MSNKATILKSAEPGEVVFGFRLIKKEYVVSKDAFLYTLRHEKTAAELLFFDRKDENKTFAVCFTTLPEDDTGVFHILEHSVLNGSQKYPLKEPFVNMLQSSMQTFLNAMTYSDKTLYPVSSRNEADFFNLMSVYMDAVFRPLIHSRPEIFMQEGWHYEFDEKGATPYFNGVVYSEMKGVFADVDSIIEDETYRLLFPDTSYGFESGGHPEHITDLTYEQFCKTHKRFYHPTNAKFFLDGSMDIDAVLKFIDGEYLSGYEFEHPDFNFIMQKPKSAEKTVCYEAVDGEESAAHMAISKIFCTFNDTEKIYGAKVLSDYLTGTNESPLKQAFLEKGLAQDVCLEVGDGVLQPTVSLIFRNTEKEKFDEIKALLTTVVKKLSEEGLDRESLRACVSHLAFVNREISEPYGIELATRALDSWLYGGNPLTHIENAPIFDSLNEKIESGWFENLLSELFASNGDKSFLYVLPSAEKGADDAKKEAERLEKSFGSLSDLEKDNAYAAFEKMKARQSAPDTEEALKTLPHLRLEDVPLEVTPVETSAQAIGKIKALKICEPTNGIVYLNLYFDVSDYELCDLKLLNVYTSLFGQLNTKNYTAKQLQTKIKALTGFLNASVELISKQGDLESCTAYLEIRLSATEENAEKATELLSEILLNTCFDDTEKIRKTILQEDYYQKQSMISSGHSYAMTKAMSAFSAAGAAAELLGGESFVKWYSDFCRSFEESSAAYCEKFASLTKKAYSASRLFTGFAGGIDPAVIESLAQKLPETEIGKKIKFTPFDKNDCTIEIPSDVAYSAIGNNIYALGGEYSGVCSVLSSLVTYGYLWGAVRVRGGAYGTGMRIVNNGNMFCYSYRDPNPEGSRKAFSEVADFINDFCKGDSPLDDIIIGTVNTTDPLLSPSSVCSLECRRYLRGTAHSEIAKIRKEILTATKKDLSSLCGVVAKGFSEGKYCAVGNRESVAFVGDSIK